MEGNIFVGVLLGASLALVNILLSFRTLRQVAEAPLRLFAAVVFKGMGLRMLLVLIAVSLVIWLAPVDLKAFALTLVVGLVIGLIIEVWVLLRTAKAKTDVRD